jgi:hypothetical protein
MRRRLKSALAKQPALKYGLLTVGTGLWIYGLLEAYSSAAIMKYLLMSLIIVAVAVI